jgi:glycine/D-amino acid oxidase-like deaminating enzyme
MYHELTEPLGRSSSEKTIRSNLVIIGGGIAGVCCAISAARAGIKVTLVQDRPVLGGNASSEVRLWILGATSHMGNNIVRKHIP